MYANIIATLTTSSTSQDVSRLFGLNKNTPSNKNASYLNELKEQHKLAKNVFITGIPRGMNSQELSQTIAVLFNKLQISVGSADIENISQSPNGVIVTFRTKEMKIRIIQEASSKCIWSNDLFAHIRAEDRKEITIDHHLTPSLFDLFV